MNSSNVDCTDDFNGILSGGYEFIPGAVGTYQIRLDNTQGTQDVLKRFDVFVKTNPGDDVDPRIDQGRLWAYRWAFDAGSFGDSHSTSANLYAVVDGGFNGSYYTWELDLDHFAGYVYELTANNLGLTSPNADGTIVAALSGCIDSDSAAPCPSVSGNRNYVEAQYKLYLSNPAASYPRPTTLPEITNFHFLDDQGVDDSISPSDTVTVQDTGNFLFTTNLAISGTYTIIIDVNNDDVFGSGDVFLNGTAVPGDNSVNWNGVDNSGNTVPNGTYKAQIVLKTGEFHFTAADAETSGGSGNNGLTINAVLDNGSIDTSNKVYWDDNSYLGLTHADSYNADGTYKYHNWGDFTSGGDGNKAYLDTYSIGATSQPVFLRLAIEPDDTPRTKMTGKVFDDANGNGAYDSGETGFSNITIAITDTTGTFFVSTDTNGDYVAYTSATESSVVIDVNESTLPVGYAQTAGTDPETVDVSAGGTISVGDDGYQVQADLRTTKVVDKVSPNVGDTVTYTLTVTNNGPAEATNVSLTDQLPTGITYASNTPSQGTYNSGTGIWTIGTLANGASANLTLSGTVDSGTSLLTITNFTTSATGDQADPTNVNDDLNESLTVVNRGPAAVNDSYTVAEDSSVTLLPLTADSDPDGDSIGVVSINGVTLTPGVAQTILVTNGTVTVDAVGVITFTPDTNYNGLVSFPYVISDGKGATATANENITVNGVNDTPTSTPIADQTNADADTPSVNVSGNFSDPDGDTLTYSATGLPTGLSIDPNTGVISGTIDKSASQSGPYSVTVTAKDSSNASTSETFSWTVTNPAPTANPDTGSTAEDTQLVVAATGVLGNDTDPDGDTLSVTGYNVGANTATVGNPLVLTEGNLTIAADGSYTFDPAANFNGPVPAVTYAISDSNGGTSSSTLTITVTPQNDTPTSTPIADQTNADADTPSVNVSGNFSDPDGDTLTYSATGLPTGLSIDPNTGVISGTIDKSASQSGPYSVTVTAKDSSNASTSETFSWTVTNPAPTANPDTGSTAEDTQLVVAATGVLGNDTDPDGDTLSVTGYNVGANTATVGNPLVLTEGNLTIAADGSYTFDPAANFNGPVPAVTYAISDSNGGTSSSTLTITVTAVDDPTVVADDSATTEEDTPVDIDVLANDTDPEGTKSPVASVTDGEHGTVTINPDGTVKYTPEENYNGTDTFTYTNEEGNTATVTVTIDPVNDAPVAEDDSQSTPINTAVSVPVLNNDHDVDGDVLAIVDVNTTDTNGTVTFDANGTVIFTPDTDFIGTTAFIYTISDGNGGTDMAVVIITVTDPQDPESNSVAAVADSASTDNTASIDIPVLNNDYDPEGDEFNLTTIITQPSNGTVSIEDNGTPNDPSDDYIIYDPNTGFVGTDTFEYEITDANGNTDVAIVTVTVVDPATDAVPNAVADGATTDQELPVSIDVLGNDTHPDNDDLNITAFTEPSNGTVTLDDNGTPDDPTDDRLVYRPNAGFSGHDTFMYTITDENGDTASAAVTVTVVAAPDVLIGDAMIVEGGDLVFDVNLTHAYGEDINLTLTLEDNTTTQGEDYIPTTVTVVIPAGSTHVTASVSTEDDGLVEADEYLDIHISTVNSGSVGDSSDTGRGTIIDNDTPPTAEDDNVNATNGSEVTIDVIQNDINGTSDLNASTVRIIDPVNGEVTTYIVPGEGTWTVDPDTGKITFTPEQGYVGDPTPIEYIVYDVDGNSDIGRVTINYMPLANNDSYGPVFEGETATLDILNNDINTSSPLDSTRVSLVPGTDAINVLTDSEGDVIGFTVPDEGMWSVDESTGEVTFDPDGNLETSDPTPIQYTVREENGEESNKALISIHYSGGPNATDNLDVPVSSYAPIVIDVLANNDDWGAFGPGTESISFTQPTYGNVALDDGGTPNDPTDDVLIYTPAADINNVTDTFTYTITDAEGHTSTAIVTVDIDCTSSQSSDGGDALGSLGMLMMMFMTLLSGFYFVRREERRGEI
ncbi:beta strand repeat-containing protein [Sulfurovum lithotrophicum]|uniref:beta strand repeat-containing protein n=1 Tax=Sulfurovum lithotrophicum TaxID=206403 RepID=UPI0014704557|nr:Ig-like domain-containing protein [Sulfurovum lithotrophicum]